MLFARWHQQAFVLLVGNSLCLKPIAQVVDFGERDHYCLRHVILEHGPDTWTRDQLPESWSGPYRPERDLMHQHMNPCDYPLLAKVTMTIACYIIPGAALLQEHTCFSSAQSTTE